jgi:hypothetical protein
VTSSTPYAAAHGTSFDLNTLDDGISALTPALSEER